MTITLREKTRLVVPPSVQRRAGIKVGDRLQFKASRGVVTILTKPADDEYTPEQRRVIDRSVAKGLDDIKKSRVYGPFNTAEEMASSIEENVKKLGSTTRRMPSTL